MRGVNRRLSSSSSSFSSSSSSSQLSTPRTLENGFLQHTLSVSPRLSSHINPLDNRSNLHASSMCWDSEKTNADKYVPSSDTPKPKSSAELRKEIDLLEFEILHLEQYLLSLYQAAFKDHIPSLSSITRKNSQCKKSGPLSVVGADQMNYKPELHKQKGCAFAGQELASSVCDTDIPYRPSFSSSLKASAAKEVKRTESGHCSLADLLGVSHMIENLDNTPNRLSEDIVRCISLIYCKLSGKARNSSGLSASPPFSLSSSSLLPSKNPCDCSEDISRNEHFAIEVLEICSDDDNVSYASKMLQNFRSLIQNLEKVDPRKMTREEKLAFWINIHNALVMHSYLAYGTPEHLKNTPILEAAYNVGGQCLNAYDIQSSILGIRPHRSMPNAILRVQTLFSPGRKSQKGNSKHAYALEYPEPLVHFALSSGTATDPVVRVFTAESIFQDLRQAKEEFIRANVYIENGTKILLPKILYYYGKDASLGMSGLIEVITGCLQETQRKAIRKCMKGRHEKCIRWLPQDSNFRYVIHGELAGERSKI